MDFKENPFLWMLLLFVLTVIIYTVRAVRGYATVARDAAEDYDYKKDHNMSTEGLSRDGYIRAYKRFNNPRHLKYVAMTIGALLVLTYPVMIFLRHLLEFIYNSSGQNRAIEPGYLVWQWILFFAILGIWAAIGYFFARQYHQRSPISMRDEILKELDRESED